MEKQDHIKHDEQFTTEVKKARAQIRKQVSRIRNDDATPTGLVRRLSSSGGFPSRKVVDSESDTELLDEDKHPHEAKAEKKDEETPNAPIGRILKLSKPEWPGMFCGAILTLASVVPDSLTPYLFGRATLALSTDGMDGVNFWMICVFSLTAVGSLLAFFKTYIFSVAGERVVLRLRLQLLEAIITSDVSKLDKLQSGELVSRLTTDVVNVESVATTALVELFTNICSLVVMMIIMFSLSWQLTTMLLVTTPMLMAIIFPMSKVAGNFQSRYQDELSTATSIAQETIANFRTVRAFAAERYGVQRYKGALGDLKNSKCWWMKDKSVYRVGVLKSMVEACFGPMVGMAFGAIIYGSLWYSLLLVSQGKFDLGLIFTFMMFSFQLMGKMGGIGGTMGSFVTASVAAGKIFALIDSTPQIPIKGGRRLESLTGQVSFHDVFFTYPGTEQTVLSGMNCVVPPETSAAFVGQSGCGKSTTLRLLERFYDVTKGSVCIDGVDVRELDGSWLRMNISYVEQEPNLFAMSISDNVAYCRNAAKANAESTDPISETSNSLISIADGSKLDATDLEIENACKFANADQFIKGLTDGYQTMVGERGMKLSGGQKQRVAIARAILKDPKIMLLDEATSALDSESEALVSEAINNMMKGRTVLLVAHRLSTVKDATSIHFVKEGKILDSGPHHQLLRSCEDYKHLVENQMG